jgi:hypothetical protein
MKQLISVRSNSIYSQKDSTNGEFKLEACLELIIIHTNDMEYKVVKNKLVSERIYSDTRITMDAEGVTALITELQFQQKKIESLRRNAEQLNTMVSHIATVETLK